MSDLFQQQSPLVQINLHKAAEGPAQIRELQFTGFINLRGRPDNTAFLAAVLKALGTEPPLEANTVKQAGDNRIFWLGPDEWLVVTPAGQQSAVKEALLKALKGVFSSVVDNTSGLTMLEITGENAADLLATDCPLDLHPRVFKAGQCAQTRLAKAGMTVVPKNDGNGFDVIIRRSFADYLLLWLLEARKAFA